MNKYDFSAGIYHNFPGHDRFDFPQYLERVTSGFGGETFLIFGSDKTVLYDSGMAYCATDTISKIKKKLNEKSRDKLDIVLISHTHYDHVGALPYVIDEWPEVVVYGAPKAKEVFKSEGAIKTMERLGEAARDAFGPKHNNQDINKKNSLFKIKANGMRIDKVVYEDDIIDIGNINIRVLETKGHTDCSLTFALEPMKILLNSESTGVLRGPDYMHTAFVKNYWESIQSAYKCKAYKATQLMIPHYGLAPLGYVDEFFNWYIKLAKEEKNMIVSMHESGCDQDEIMKKYIQEYWSEERSKAQPFEAFLENGRHIINNIIRHYKEEDKC